MTSSFIQQRMRRAPCLMAIAGNLLLIIAATAQPRDPERYQITVRSLEFGTPELVTYNLDGTNPRRLGPEGLDGQNPAWSPDGTQLAFSSSPRGQLYLLYPDTMRQVHLTDNSRAIQDPAWSADGHRIAYQSNSLGKYQLFVMNADSSEIIEIEPELDASKVNPAWSPDGKFLAFSIGERIILVDADTCRRMPVDLLPGNYPAWSPDSRIIAMHNTKGQFLVGAVDGSGVRQLIHGEGHNNSPAWSPDGRYIAYRHSSVSPWREDVLSDLVIFDVITETHTPILHQKLPRWGARPSWRPFPTEVAN